MAASAEHWARIAQQAGNAARREAEIAVPALAWMFPDGEDAVWVVRNLSSSEFWQANNAADRDNKLKSLVAAMASGENQADAIRDALALNRDDVPDEVRKRIAMIEMGTIKPEIPKDQMHDIAVVLAEHHTEEFFAISNKVMAVTMAGSEVGKPKRSTRKKVSE